MKKSTIFFALTATLIAQNAFCSKTPKKSEEEDEITCLQILVAPIGCFAECLTVMSKNLKKAQQKRIEKEKNSEKKKRQ